MQIIADLQLHSRFSRAVSPQMTIPFIAEWAKKKGIGLVATGDWTHPMWFREIQRDLEEVGNGLLRLKDDASAGSFVIPNPDSRGEESPPAGEAGLSLSEKKSRIRERSLDFARDDKASSPLFLLATEVSCIFSQGGKGRRIHILIWVPSIASAEKINKEMTRRGCNLLSDGRPIIGLSAIQVAELVLSIEPKALVIPAHCLLPDSMILGDGFVPKRIDAMAEGNVVLTHSGELHKVTEVKKRPYKGTVLHIKPWYFRSGLATTPEHPYYAIKTIKKCPSTGDVCRPSKAHLAVCKRKECLAYKSAWIKAEDLTIGDILVYPRPLVAKNQADISLGVSGQKGISVHAGGTRGRVLENRMKITTDLGRLVGYYIAEGSTDGNNNFSFCFSEKEQRYVDDVRELVKNVFGINHYRIYRRKQSKGVEITFYSKLHAQWFFHHCYVAKKHSASDKAIPTAILQADKSVQAECLRGWYRGDKGYTTSRILMNQLKAVSLCLGIIPSVIVDTIDHHRVRGNHVHNGRSIHAKHDCYAFSNFAFFEDTYHLKSEIKRSQTKIDRRHGWIDKDNVYLPIKDIKHIPYEGEVYNLEVEKDHTYVAEYAVVHNCWTPWFSLYGSMSGFNSIDEAFGPYAKNIYAVETGLSSNPSMNWRIKELDNRAIVSFSDAHSGPKLGREATVFEVDTLGYDAIYDAIIQKTRITQNVRSSESQKIRISESQTNRSSESSEFSKSRIAYTIEFYPEEGKYHYSGHRACNIRWGPEETKKNGNMCPVCGKKLVQGVEQRVEELAGRSEGSLQLSAYSNQLSDETTIRMIQSKTFPNRPPFVMLVPLQEIIAEAIGSPVTSVKVQPIYERLVSELGSEFTVLMQSSVSSISRIAGERTAEGIEKVRRGDIVIEPGYDGVFGVVKIWREGEESLVDKSKEQLSMFP